MIVIVQNDPHCPPGLCTGLIDAAGGTLHTVAAYADEPFPDLSPVTGVIVLGGEMGVHDTERFPFLERVRTFMTRAIEAGTPLLGICLGGQLLAQLAGGEVSSPSRHGEKGISLVSLTPAGAIDPLFAGLPTDFVTFQLHNDSFSVPPGATLLAGSALCPTQAFRLGRHGYGVQFHPEVERRIVAAWGALSTHPTNLLAGFLEHEDEFNAASRALLANFLTLAGLPRNS